MQQRRVRPFPWRLYRSTVLCLGSAHLMQPHASFLEDAAADGRCVRQLPCSLNNYASFYTAVAKAFQSDGKVGRQFEEDGKVGALR